MGRLTIPQHDSRQYKNRELHVDATFNGNKTADCNRAGQAAPIGFLSVFFRIDSPRS